MSSAPAFGNLGLDGISHPLHIESCPGCRGLGVVARPMATSTTLVSVSTCPACYGLRYILLPDEGREVSARAQ